MFAELVMAMMLSRPNHSVIRVCPSHSVLASIDPTETSTNHQQAGVACENGQCYLNSLPKTKAQTATKGPDKAYTPYRNSVKRFRLFGRR